MEYSFLSNNCTFLKENQKHTFSGFLMVGFIGFFGWVFRRLYVKYNPNTNFISNFSEMTVRSPLEEDTGQKNQGEIKQVPN